MSAIVRASYPVSFQLLNRDRQPILGIFDGQQGQTLKLDITNSSRRDMKPKQLTGNATADNHHFELRFRPGTLVLPDSASPNRPAISVEEPGWKISERPAVSDAGVSFYLLITNPTPIESGKSTSVTLKDLSGDGKVGAHGTRVELKWNNSLEWVASAGQSPEPLVPGHRLQHLSVVNQSGQKQIPLHIGIVGNDKVLNNKTANVLQLRISNLIKPDPLKPGEGNIRLNPGPDPKEPAATKFIFSFDASTGSQKDPWALGFIQQVNKIGINAGTKFNTPTPTEQSQSVQWIMWPTEAITLKPGDSIDVNITNIVTEHPSGLTNLYIHYKNVPGYWDGDFVATIEKAPLVYSSTGVGIGKNPDEKLNVKGNLRIDNGEIVFGQVPSQIKAANDDHRLIFGIADFELKGGGPIVFSPGPDKSPKATRTVILPNGNVGIGTTDPAKHLHVQGTGDQEIMIESLDQGGQWSLQSSATAGRFNILNRNEPSTNCFTILKNGNVGVGTTDPKAKLQVDGDARVMGSVRIAEDRELVLENRGRIKCFDNNHVIEFRRDFQPDLSVLEIREHGMIMFSPGAKDGVQTAKVVMLHNGKVGIGTTTPAAPLHVIGGQANSFTLGRWMDGANLGEKGGQRSDLKHSIIADERIRAAAFDTVSDARVKNVLGTSGGASDLDALLKIIITDYTYKDVIGKGNGTYKKVIGQQIEKVFPQAVSRTTDVVPDIYQQASIRGGWISLATDLKKGDRVKLIAESGKEDMHEVLEVTGDKFRVDLEPEGEKIFVYGREVDDFLTVDYDAIAMLNVSATQQIKKDMDHELKALRVENAELRAANDALATRLQLLESRLETGLGVVSANNANGRH